MENEKVKNTEAEPRVMANNFQTMGMILQSRNWQYMSSRILVLLGTNDFCVLRLSPFLNGSIYHSYFCANIMACWECMEEIFCLFSL